MRMTVSKIDIVQVKYSTKPLKAWSSLASKDKQP